MNIAQISALVRATAWTQTAAVFGVPATLYRPTGPIAPLSPGNILSVRLAALDTTNKFTFDTPQKFGDPTFFVAIDPTGCVVGDYFTQDDTAYFFSNIDPVAAPQVVRCNNVVTLLRTQMTLQPGANDYGASTPGTDTVLLAGWPCSILRMGRGDRGDVGLPGDTRMGWWAVTLPVSVPMTPRGSDLLSDDQGRRFIISSAELTFMGWRLLAMQVAV